jgi:protein-S-isoprenylcysteine O-methyltransferase Ste14
MPWLELKIPPLLVVLLFGLAMLGASYLAPSLAFPFPGHVALATCLVVLGGVVAVAGVVAFRKQGTTVNPMTPGATSSVVSTGIYRYSRNPMYLGFLLALAGVAVYLSHAAALVLVVAFVAYLNRYQIEPEERALLGKFGPAFAQYTSRVRRWL